jgi:hypothetical protein
MWMMRKMSDEGSGRFVPGDKAHCIHLTEQRVVHRAGMVVVRKRITGMVALGKRITDKVVADK